MNSEVDAGLIIHEGQITYEDLGLKLLLDLPKLWYNDCNHPIPLGLNVVNRSLDEEIQFETAKMIKDSISYALSNIDEALDYAMEFSRGVSRDVAKEFVLMYVNNDTLDLKHRGLDGLKYMYETALRKGLIKYDKRKGWRGPLTNKKNFNNWIWKDWKGLGAARARARVSEQVVEAMWCSHSPRVTKAVHD